MYRKVKSILDQRFVFCDEMAFTIGLALQRGMNAWLYGDGGYGKSDMVKCALQGLGLYDKTFVQCFGQGMTPEKLLGNMDVKAYHNEREIRYNVDKSFMAHEIAVFEEMPDAAPSVLFILKDILEAMEFRDGAVRVPVKTRVVFVCSNRTPAEISELGKDAEALTQRWPLEHHECWECHNQKAYEALFSKRAAAIEGPKLGDMAAPLASLLADVSGKGNPIPPRIALKAAEALIGHAQMRGAALCQKEDFVALRKVRGLQCMGKNALKEIEESIARADIENQIKAIEKEVSEAITKMKNNISLVASVGCTKELRALANKAGQLKVNDAHQARKDDLISTLTKALDESIQKSEALHK